MVEPDFSFKTQPSTLARKRETLAPKGKLSVKLIAARSLSAPSHASRPYVVVTFDQNEFVSREPIHAEGEEATGVANARDGRDKNGAAAATAAPGLGAGDGIAANGAASGLGRALDAYRKVTPDMLTPPATPVEAMTPSVPSTASEHLSFSAYNPTWKHEVFLSVLLSPCTALTRLSDVMHEKSMIQVQIFDRSVEEEMFLGMAEIRPLLVNGHTVDQWFPYAPPSVCWPDPADSHLAPTNPSRARSASRSATRSLTCVVPARRLG